MLQFNSVQFIFQITSTWPIWWRWKSYEFKHD